MIVERSIHADVPVEVAYAYLADFENSREWDAGTVTTVLESGDGGVGTRYRNTSRFLGRETHLVYTVIERRENEILRLKGKNKTVTVNDTMTFARDGSGTVLTYRAEFDFHGIAGVISPLLRPAVNHLAEGAEDGLQRELGRLATTQD